MAWSLSISPEGWEDVRKGLENMSREALVEALCDDEYERVEEARRYSMEREEIPEGAEESAAALVRQRLLPLPHDVLVDAAYEAVERTHTCDNGGFRVWIDRQGYHGVTLS